MRREAQQIVPGVYLGPFQASTSLSNLRNLGITHMCVPPGEGPTILERWIQAISCGPPDFQLFATANFLLLTTSTCADATVSVYGTASRRG